ncbi:MULTISPECIES: response regulator transcription factor [unclassified Frankia]|uniref:response regulator transcription factor n=1 Tax=unclassified Frankia TaxID=2632575 RepID=UPI001EF5E57E|nr:MULTISPECIES: response regulator transcription factor [unclassified Frankia]
MTITENPGEARSRRIGVVDDEPVYRDSLPLLVPELNVVVAARTVEEFLALAPRVLAARPHAGMLDAVLVDLDLSGSGGRPSPVHGRHAVAAVAAAGYRVLIYTGQRRPLVLAGCLGAGALGIVHKSERPARLVDAVDAIAAGRLVLTTAVTGLAEAVSRSGALPDLTERQREVLRARARGEPYSGIAQRLHIDRKTAEEHMSVVARKFRDYLREHSPADLERELGIGSGDLME